MSSSSKAETLAKQWVAGAIAGFVESIITMPFEVLKTKLQISGGTTWSSAKLFSKHLNARENFRSAFAGLTPVLLQTSMKIGIRFAAFETIRPYAPSIVAGFGAGAFEALVWITPTERLKVLRINSGTDHQSIVRSIRLLQRTQGIMGLWRGGTATVTRNAVSVGIRFWLVENIVRLLKQMSPETSSLHSGMAGFIAGGITTVINQPLDAIKTHMSADQVAGETPKFSSNEQCARYLWQKGGVRGYYTGCGARITKVSIGQAVIFAVYEKVLNQLP